MNNNDLTLVQNPNDTTKETEKQSAKSACCGIYGLRNKTNGKWYIGQSWEIDVRWKKYKWLNCKRQPKIYNALLKYGYDGFDKIIVEIISEKSTQKEIDDRESNWIIHYNSVDDGYNLNHGGNASGKKSPETREKIRIKQTGKNNSFYGRTHSNDVKEFLRNKFTGRVFSAEWRAKLSAAAKNRYKK